MKMSEKTLLKKIEQAFNENYCNGTYKLELVHDYDECTYYVLYYTYETGETISVDITATYLGEVKFYSNVHCHYISNFNSHVKSVVNVLRMLFDMIDSNKDIMIKYNEIKPETEETNETETDGSASGNDVFDGCKTVKDVMEVKQELNARFGKEQYFDTDSVQPNKTIIEKIENINHCPNQNTCCIVSPFAHCNYNYKSDSCIKAHKNFVHDCEQVHKQMKAINKPNWHTVRLATVNSNDFGRLNEKLKLYISTYRELKQTLSYLRKCKTINTYDSCYVRYIKKQNDMCAKGKFTNAMLNYIRAKLSMQNVESGVWASDCEEATGYHESRRYNKSRIDL